jgi:hypothetical protein
MLTVGTPAVNSRLTGRRILRHPDKHDSPTGPLFEEEI